MIFLEINWNWSLLPITFSISLLSIFNSTIGLNIFGKSYEALLGLGMIMEDNVLKYDSQWPKLIHILAILVKFLRYELLLIITLRYLQDNLSEPEVKELLHLIIELLNSFSENGIYFIIGLFEISSNKSGLIW